MQVITTENKPIKMWLNEIEDGALVQAENLANLPFTFKHIAIMPDSHLGYGMPIGGVVATKGVIIPNAVGVDIGCFDKETEFLSPNGWKKIPEWDGEAVAQFDPSTNEAVFTMPVDYIKEKCDEFYHIKTKYGVDQMISKDHRCLIYKHDRKGKYDKHEVVVAKELYKIHTDSKLGVRDRFLTSFRINRTTRVGYSDSVLRVIVMLSVDGYLDKNKFVLQLTKRRKIDRAKKLLKNASIDFNESSQKNGVTRISFNKVLVNNFDGREVILEKGLEKLWAANYSQLKIIVEEVLYWDGNQKDKIFFTRKKEEADFIHYAISATGKRGVLRSDKHKDGKTDYRVYQYENIKIGIAGTLKLEIKKVKSVDGYKYSFTVPTSFLITRRNGNVVVTGNCGMCAVRTSLTEMDTDTLKSVMREIRKAVPVGFNKHEEMQDKDLMPKDLTSVNFLNEYPVCCKEFERARKSLGTLGGGNHFIEIQKGDDGHIWIMIHSGSRNLGKQVADYYNKLAIGLNKKWHSLVPKEWELAFLPIDSEEGQTYIREMEYCVEFAFANRKLMMSRCLHAFLTYAPIQLNETNELINIAHNYAAQENHYGQNVWVHRKGATLAREGTTGVIPGSQGTKSYIVKGKGNPESFMSCSHGAGRRMGRRQAQRELNLEEEQKRLDDQGILHSIRGEKDLDEASGAYKAIGTVMKNQEDLVDVLVELTPLGTVKG